MERHSRRLSRLCTLARRVSSSYGSAASALWFFVWRGSFRPDYSLDVVARDQGALVEKLLGYAETDTLCFRADPEEPLYRRQQELWEPIVAGLEAREGVTLHRISGILHRPQTEETRQRLTARLGELDPFTLASLKQTTSLAASLCIGLEALQQGADGDALWAAANLDNVMRAARAQLSSHGTH